MSAACLVADSGPLIALEIRRVRLEFIQTCLAHKRGHFQTTPKPRPDRAREHRIADEIVVDAYNETERAMGCES